MLELNETDSSFNNKTIFHSTKHQRSKFITLILVTLAFQTKFTQSVCSEHNFFFNTPHLFGHYNKIEKLTENDWFLALLFF